MTGFALDAGQLFSFISFPKKGPEGAAKRRCACQLLSVPCVLSEADADEPNSHTERPNFIAVSCSAQREALAWHLNLIIKLDGFIVHVSIKVDHHLHPPVPQSRLYLGELCLT